MARLTQFTAGKQYQDDKPGSKLKRSRNVSDKIGKVLTDVLRSNVHPLGTWRHSPNSYREDIIIISLPVSATPLFGVWQNNPDS
jgi:hypothetical protein